MESIPEESKVNYSRSLASLVKHHQPYKRSLEQVLTDLEPVASKLHISSAVFLILVFLIIAFTTTAFAFAVYMFHRRHKRRQQQQMDEVSQTLDTREHGGKAVSRPFRSHKEESSQVPRDATRRGRYSWNSHNNVDLTRGPSNGSGSGEDTLVDDELMDHPWDRSGRKLYTVSERTEESSIRNPSPLPVSTHHMQQYHERQWQERQQHHPLRHDWRKSHSSESSETAHDDGPEPDRSNRYPTPPTFRITHEDDEKVGSDRESAYEDIYDDYYGGGDDRGSMVSRMSRNQPSAMSRHLNVAIQGEGAKHESMYSFDGLVDMYAAGSPVTEKGGGSPIASSPTKGWFSRSVTRNSDHSMLSPIENLARNFSRSSLGRSARRPSPVPPIILQPPLPRGGSPYYASDELARKESDISLSYPRPQPPELGLPHTRSNGPLPSLLQPRTGQVHDDSPDASPIYSPSVPQHYISPHGSLRECEHDIASPIAPSPRQPTTPLSIPPPLVPYKPPPVPQDYLTLPSQYDSKRTPAPFLRNTPTPGASSYSSSASTRPRPPISPMHSTTSSNDQAMRRKMRGMSLYGEIMRMGGSGASVSSRGGS
ncbi:hypothetical protein FRB97_001457 [Tulasnella sp. 331]|nr:hypothetical protein FRB97_001457 [Tulasnella sp. 331]KAG8886103.1 hypothetical protein FRB98_001477 [Tulasnella sp. 332]